MKKINIQLVTLSFTLLFVACQNSKQLVEPDLNINTQNRAKQEHSHSHDWLKVWNTCSGNVALKKDGSLWQFGELGGCHWGEITIGKPKETYHYHLTPKKIADGFKDAKIVNGAYRLFAIKKDGTLWRWDKEHPTPKQIGKDTNWQDVGINTPVHDGLDYDIGLKKDGSLWEISSTKTRALVKSKGWQKVLVKCCDIYAQQKDGSIKHIHTYLDELNHNQHEAEITPAKKHFYSESEQREFLSTFSKLRKGTVVGDNFASQGKKVKTDGTLWLLPEVRHD